MFDTAHTASTRSTSDFARLYCLEVRVGWGSILRVLLPVLAVIWEDTVVNSIDNVLGLCAAEQQYVTKHGTHTSAVSSTD